MLARIGHPRQPPLPRVHQLQHPRRALLSRRRACVPRARCRAVAGDDGGRELRGPHPEHHRRAVDHQRRRAQPGGGVAQRHHGVASRGVRSRQGRDGHAARPSATGAAKAKAAAARVAGTLRGARHRSRHADPLARRVRSALALRVRRPHPRRVRGRASARRALGLRAGSSCRRRTGTPDPALAHRSGG